MTTVVWTKDASVLGPSRLMLESSRKVEADVEAEYKREDGRMDSKEAKIVALGIFLPIAICRSLCIYAPKPLAINRPTVIN